MNKTVEVAFMAYAFCLKRLVADDESFVVEHKHECIIPEFFVRRFCSGWIAGHIWRWLL